MASVEVSVTLKYRAGRKAHLMDTRDVEQFAMEQLRTDMSKLKLPQPKKENVSFHGSGMAKMTWLTTKSHIVYTTVRGIFPVTQELLDNLFMEYMKFSEHITGLPERPASPPMNHSLSDTRTRRGGRDSSCRLSSDSAPYPTNPNLIPITRRVSGNAPKRNDSTLKCPSNKNNMSAFFQPYSKPDPPERERRSRKTNMKLCLPSALPSLEDGIKDFSREDEALTYSDHSPPPPYVAPPPLPDPNATMSSCDGNAASTISLEPAKAASTHLYDSDRTEKTLLNRLTNVRALLSENIILEKSLLDELRGLGNVESQNDYSLHELEGMLAEEKRKRMMAERLLTDVERECRHPFVVPALLEAFGMVSTASLNFAA